MLYNDDMKVDFRAYRCYYDNCIPPPDPLAVTATPGNGVPWSAISSWDFRNGSKPVQGDNVTIPIGKATGVTSHVATYVTNVSFLLFMLLVTDVSTLVFMLRVSLTSALLLVLASPVTSVLVSQTSAFLSLRCL